MRSFVLVLAALACSPLAGCVTTGMALKPGPSEKPSDPEQLPELKTAELQLTLAEEMIHQGQGVGAIVQLEKARQNDPRLNGRAARKLGVLYDLAGEPAKALIEFQEALKEFPRDPDLLTDVGYAYYNRGNWEESEKYLRQALVVDGHHKRAHMNLGMALAQQGRADEALAAFGTVVSPAEAQANLGFLLLTQGKREEARQAYRRALELEPGLAVARTALEKMDKPPAGRHEAAYETRGASGDRPSAAGGS